MSTKVTAVSWAGTIWSNISPSDIGKVAGLLSIIWTSILIFGWAWKNFFRPFCVARGWLKPRKRLVILEE